jgi:hypothetical protein
MASNALDLLLPRLALMADNAAFCFWFFFTRQLEERKRMGEREKFGHLLSFVPAWLVVRNAKLFPTTLVATVVMLFFR